LPDPFISTTDLVNYIGVGSTTDPAMLMAVDAACDVCRDVAERDFNLTTATVTLDGPGTDALVLPNRHLPALTAGTVMVNGIAEANYTLDTRRGILFRGTAGVFPRPSWPYGRQNIAVTLNYGYGTAVFPRSVKMVALAIASRLVVQGAAGEETVGDVRVKYAAASTDLTSGERLILSKLRGIR